MVTNLKNAYESEGKQLIEDFEKNISLAIIDDSWKEHLRKMDELKQSVQLAVHEQKDPLLIYKFEAFELFKTLMDKINRDIVSFLFKGELPARESQPIREARNVRRKQNIQTSKEEVLNSDEMAMRNRQVGCIGWTADKERLWKQLSAKDLKLGEMKKLKFSTSTSGERKTVKFKQAEPLLIKGEWVLIETS